MHEPGGPLADTTILGPALAVAGGAVSYLQRLKRRKGAIFSLAAVAIECFIAGFVGVLTTLVCQSKGVEMHLAAALAGVSGHMGSRLLYIAEQRFTKQIAGDSE